MLKIGKTRILAFALALMMALVLLPAAALAEGDAGHIVLFSDVTDDTEKSYLQTATAAPGETMTVYVPILNKDLASASTLKCALPVSTVVKDYPFDQPTDATILQINADAYQMWNATDSKLVSWDGTALAQGERAYFKFSYKVAASTPTGGYTLPFTVSYSDGSNSLTDTVNVYVYVNEKTSSSSSGGSSYKSKPKVILESYSFVEDTIYAGDTITLRLVVSNTSEREAITNLQLDYSNDAGAILPAPGGSSSIFIGTIDKSDAYAFSIRLQIAPDAEAKSQLLTVKLSYEGTRNRQEFEETASVSVPVQQKARVRINDPVVYDDPWVGGTVSVGLTLYNLGKSPLYNCLVDLEDTPNMTLEEAYFGGNVASGGTMRADLSITPLVGGEVTGNIRVTYEDVYGNQTEQLLPITMLVNEDTGNGGANIYVSGSNAVIPAEIPADAPASSGLAWYWIALIVCAVIGAAAIIIVRVKKKRERSLEDDDI